MILTDEQRAGWEAELATYNADITRSNLSIAEHNALLPPEIPQVPLRALLTLDEYVQMKLDDIARAGANKARAEAKTPLQLLAEHDAMVIQLQAVTDDKTAIEAARVQLVADLAAKTTEYNTTKASLDAKVLELTAKEAELTASKEANTKLVTDHADAMAKLVSDHGIAINAKEAELTTANATIAELESDLSVASSQLEAVTTEKQSLEAQLDAILHPPGPDVTTVTGLREHIATVRYNHEVGGFTIGDQFVSTNRDELAHWFARFYDAFNWLSGNEIARATNPQGLYPYKPKGGTKVTMLTAQQAVRAYQCLAWYVNACIATEGALIGQIESGTIRLDLILDAANDNQQWPQTRFEWTA